MKIVPIQLNIKIIPAYIQIAEMFQNMIRSGEIFDGERFPSVRKLAKELGVSNATVIAAYQYLEQNGLVYTKPGSGTYLLPADRMMPEEAAQQPAPDRTFIPDGCINLAGNTPGPEMFPANAFKEAINRVLDMDGGNAFTYQESGGSHELRREIVRYVNTCFSIQCTEETVLVTSGAQQALDLISKALLSANDVVLTENPTYRGAHSPFTLRGAKVLGVPVEPDGINMDILKHYIQRYRPRLVYTMPTFQMPTGVCMSAQKRTELLRLAEHYDFYVLEEDLLSDLSLDGHRPIPLRAEDTQERVIYIKSFSKIIMPGIRMGFMILPKRIIQAIIDVKYYTDISASGLIQRALGLYLQSGAWATHFEKMTSQYRERMETAAGMMFAWTNFGVSFQKPKGGFGIWIKLPEKFSDAEVFHRCLNHNVLINKGSSFYISPMHEYRRYIRISYAAPGIGEIEAGLKTVETSIRTLAAKKAKRAIFTV